MKSTSFLPLIQISIVVFIFNFFLFNSCSPNKVWDIPIDEVRRKLSAREYSFLNDIDFTKYKTNDVKRLGSGAFFYFYFIFKDHCDHNKKKRITEDMLLLTLKQTGNIYSSEASIIYLQNLNKEKKYALLEKNAKLYLKQKSYKELKNIAERMLISALYWQKKDKEVLNKLSKYYPNDELVFKDDPEIILFKAVSICRLGYTDWQKEFIKLFLNTENPIIHKRAYNFITQDIVRFNSFDEDIKILITVRNLISSNEPSFALPLIEFFIKKIKPVYLSDSNILTELRSIYISIQNYKKGAEYILSLSEKLSGKARLKALEAVGRIQRKAENFEESIKALQIVIKQTDDLTQRDRSIWFLLSSALKISTDIFLQELEKYISDWSDPEYFDDILEKGMSSVISEKKWNYVQRLYLLTKEAASENILTKYSYIMARLIKLDYIRLRGKSKENVVKEYLKYAVKKKSPDYYAFKAALSLKELPQFLNTKKKSTKKNKKGKKKINTEYNKLIQGFLDYGLILEAYNMLNKNIDSVDNYIMFQTVRKLRLHNFQKQSILLMNTFLKRSAFNLTSEELKYSYPKEYNKEIIEVTGKYNIKTSLFYALIREESAFDHLALSRTGATGLTQLMPETASETAQWMRLKEYDLKNPATNIKIGAYHFHRLKRVIDNIPKILIAYNAGLGKLRYWERSYKGLPDDLFVEALPYEETKDYVRKIILSTVLYEYIYNSTDPKETFLFFFPDLF